MNTSRNKAIFYLVITSVLWSIGGIFIKLVDWNPMAIAGARSGIASMVMLFYLKKLTRPLGKLKIMGAFSYASLLIFFVSANKLTTSANAILLQFTAPIWVILFSRWFLKEKSKKSDIFTVIIVLLGMTLFFIGDLKSGNLAGNLIAILSGISMAAVVMFLKGQKGTPPLDMLLLGNIITFICGLPFYFQSLPSWRSIIGLLILGIFQLGISYILYSIAIKSVTSMEAILIPILEPLLNPIWVLLITGEAPGKYAILGGIIVVTAIISRSIYQQNLTMDN